MLDQSKPYLSSKQKHYYPAQPELVTFQAETEDYLDDSGNPAKRVIYKSAENSLVGLNARDFDLDVIIATGSLDALKQTPLIQGGSLAMLDAFDSHVEYLSTLKTDVNE